MQAIKLGFKRLDGAPIDGLHQSGLKKGDECRRSVHGSAGKKGGDADGQAPWRSERGREWKSTDRWALLRRERGEGGGEVGRQQPKARGRARGGDWARTRSGLD